MKRKLRMTLEVEIDEMPMADRRENAKLGACKERELPSVEDIDPGDLADLIAGSIEINDEMFGGSEMYCRVVGTRALNPGWHEDQL